MLGVGRGRFILFLLGLLLLLLFGHSLWDVWLLSGRLRLVGGLIVLLLVSLLIGAVLLFYVLLEFLFRLVIKCGRVSMRI